MKKCLLLFTFCLCIFLLKAQTQLGADVNGVTQEDQSGNTVSLSADGSRMAIGAPYDDGSATNSGHARIYDWNGTAWVQVGSNINGEAGDDQSSRGLSISGDGDRIAIGAPYNDGNGSSSGHVRIYDWNGSAWVQVGSDINGEAASDNSGTSVSLSFDGSRIAIGANKNDGNGSNAGHVRIYNWNGTAWVQLGSDIDGEAANDYSGQAVSLSTDGSRVAIGAPYNDGNGANSGHVQIYDWNGSAWIQLGSDLDGEAADDNLGWSVSLSADGSRVASGAYLNDGNGSNAGHARIYEWNGAAWIQVGSDIDGEATVDLSGYSVSLSSDGNIIAIGAYYNDGNGSDAGQVRIYEWNGTAWIQFGSDIDGEAAYDHSGKAVFLSADGARVAIGAPKNDGSVSNAGHVRVYNNSCSSSYSIPTTSGTYTSTSSRTTGDWTHYCDANNKLLLSLDIGSSGAVVADDEVTLKIGSSVTDYYALDCGATPACFIDLTSGAVAFNREWDVNPTTQPSSGDVGVKFYFTQTEYDSVNTRIDDLGQTQLTGIDQLWFYKVTNTALGQFPSIDNVTPDDVLTIQNHANTPATNQWVQSTKTAGSEYIAEFLVSSFSGGGGGGAEDGLSPLPIELIYFHAYADREDVQLKWATVSELNNRGFEIQRSEDGIDWEALDFINGEGTETAATHYGYTDKNPKAGLNYYRLQQEDFDGKSQYLPVQVVDMKSSQDNAVEIFPNPAKDFLNITNVKGEGMIYNLAGQMVKKVSLAEEGINTFQITNLQKGIYQILVIRDNGEQVVKRFFK
jgi:hypothetical protein